MAPGLTGAEVVETERLRLVPVRLPLIEAVLQGDLDRAQALAPFDVTEQTFADDGHVLQLRRDQLRADPGEQPWLFRAAVRRTGREVVGRIGFHAPPQDGVVEVGYSVAPTHRRQGYALEMTRGLLGWGAAHGARECLGSARPDNAASLAVLDRLGFVRIGEQLDEIDGLEWVFRRPLP